MKIKSKIKNGQLIVQLKLPSGTAVNEQEMNVFSRKMIRGFLRFGSIKRSTVELTGPAGIPLANYLKKPISKYDFFLINEQIIDAAQKLQKSGLLWNRVVWDIHYAYINESTKELQLIYLPALNAVPPAGTVRSFVESILYSAIPAAGHDTAFVSRFAYFIQTMNGFEPQRVEDYIQREDHSVVSTIKRTRNNSSGFMTDKPRDYYQHYNSEGDEPTDLLRENDESTALLDDDAPTGLLTEDDEATGLLADDDEATGLLTDDGGETALLTDSDDDATGLLVENQVHYPTLYRVQTEETISINKPVFRIGKERSYVDYFVSNNNAVSRSHADIVTRGTRFFVIDLNSKNRTFINDQMIPIQYEIEILEGDRLRLGNEEFVFHV